MSNDLKQQLTAISLLDGRNWDKVRVVSDYFSEFALIKYRLKIEIFYLIFLAEKTKVVKKLSLKEKELLNNIWQKLTPDEAVQVKEVEKKINHDVKAIEYFIRDKISETSLKNISEFIHFGLTSYDINIPSYALMLSDFRKEILIPQLGKLLKSLKNKIKETKDMPMLGRTHGQPALPTTMGKELSVFYSRLKKEIEIISDVKVEAKLNGAVGNFNSFYFVMPEVDWINFSRQFITSLGLTPNLVTTQILPYDSWLRMFDSLKRLNNILLGLSQDIWWYISFEYFLQQKKPEEVGSSTMSHKINPVTFENAEGNLGMANAIFDFFVKKLSVSRLQRDLSDSTVKRNFGLAFGFTLLAWDSLLSGISRITPNPQKMQEDLDGHWEIFSEGIQTYLRLHGYKNAFETLKEKTRGAVLTKEKLYRIIDDLPITDKDRKYLKIKNLRQYLGKASKLAELAI